MGEQKKVKIWLDIHQAVSLFFLPLVLIYVLTGVLDIFDFHRPQPLVDAQIDLPTGEGRAAQEAVINDFLKAHGLGRPQGAVRYYDRSIFWGPRTGLFLGIDLNLEGGPSRIRVFEPNLYYRLLALHKGQGRAVFKWFTYLFGLVYSLVYLSALLLFFKRYRGLILGSLVSGAAVTLLFFCCG